LTFNENQEMNNDVCVDRPLIRSSAPYLANEITNILYKALSTDCRALVQLERD